MVAREDLIQSLEADGNAEFLGLVEKHVSCHDHAWPIHGMNLYKSSVISLDLESKLDGQQSQK